MLWKFQTQVTQGQVTRSRQVTSPHKKFKCSSTLHRQNGCLFQRLLQERVTIKFISQNFDIGDLRSGQFGDFSIISQDWGENGVPNADLIRKWYISVVIIFCILFCFFGQSEETISISPRKNITIYCSNFQVSSHQVTWLFLILLLANGMNRNKVEKDTLNLPWGYLVRQK